VSTLVSVVIPTFNRQRFVTEAVESVLAQTYKQLEVIVVDDGSTDGTGIALQNRFSGEKRFRYVFQANQERSRARNHGVSLAKGEYTAFLDSDDLWAKEKISAQIHILKSDTEAGMAVTWWEMFDEVGCRTPIHFPSLEDIGNPNFDILLATSNRIGSSTPLVRTSLLKKAGLFDEKINQGEDWDLWARIALRTKVALVPQILAYRRVHSENTECPLIALDYLKVARNILRSSSSRRQDLKPALLSHYANILGKEKGKPFTSLGALLIMELNTFGYSVKTIWRRRLIG
jgi:glycosyltransferase involved in cell wall biosynthesis